MKLISGIYTAAPWADDQWMKRARKRYKILKKSRVELNRRKHGDGRHVAESTAEIAGRGQASRRRAEPQQG